MTLTTESLLLLLALICFIIAAVGVPVPRRVNLMALGLAFLTASLLLP
jgi:hypothetical protein